MFCIWFKVIKKGFGLVFTVKTLTQINEINVMHKTEYIYMYYKSKVWKSKSRVRSCQTPSAYPSPLYIVQPVHVLKNACVHYQSNYHKDIFKSNKTFVFSLSVKYLPPLIHCSFHSFLARSGCWHTGNRGNSLCWCWLRRWLPRDCHFAAWHPTVLVCRREWKQPPSIGGSRWTESTAVGLHSHSLEPWANQHIS